MKSDRLNEKLQESADEARLGLFTPLDPVDVKQQTRNELANEIITD